MPKKERPLTPSQIALLHKISAKGQQYLLLFGNEYQNGERLRRRGLLDSEHQATLIRILPTGQRETLLRPAFRLSTKGRELLAQLDPPASQTTA